MHPTAAARVDLRRRRATGSADRPRPTPSVGSEDFAWLAGATGVKLDAQVRAGLQALSVAGDIDHASIDVIERVLDDMFQRLPARVELDLSRVSFIDDAGGEMVTWATAQARAKRVPFHVTPPACRQTPSATAHPASGEYPRGSSTAGARRLSQPSGGGAIWRRV